MIDPQIFATCVTAAVAILSPLLGSIGARAADVQRRRIIDDAAALLAFHRDWHQFTRELEKHADSRRALIDHLHEVESDLTTAWDRSRRPTKPPFLRRLALPYEARSVGGWILHALYYAMILAFVFDLSSTVIGSFDSRLTSEEVSAGIVGGVFFSSAFAVAALALRYVANRVDRRAMARLTTAELHT